MIERKIPLPAGIKHPLRYSIEGDTDRIPELKKIVEASDLHAGLKSFLQDELDGIKTNSGSLWLHLVDHADGSFTLDVHTKPVHLGARPKTG